LRDDDTEETRACEVCGGTSWKLACEDADVPFFNPYRLRHTWATTLRSEGLDLADAQELIGHTRAKTTSLDRPWQRISGVARKWFHPDWERPARTFQESKELVERMLWETLNVGRQSHVG